MKQPPILFINTDQLRPDFLGCYGFPLETSPNIDRIAREGTRFDNAFTQSPICVPARYSLTSGQYVCNHGAYTNNHAPFPQTRSLLNIFNRNNYHTVAIGKLHHNPTNSAFGFEEVHLHDGTFRERRKFSIYSKWLIENGIDEELLCYPADIDDDPLKKPFKNKLHWGPCQLDDEYFESTFLVNYANDYIEAYDNDKPIFLYLSFLAPHSPYCPPKPYDTMFNPADMPVPTRERPEHWQNKNQAFLENNRFLDNGEGVSEEVVRATRAQYCGLIRHMDDQIGKAIDTFKAKFGDDVIICFTSDHGDFLGEHHRWEKHFMYEAAVRIPFIMCWPGHIQADYRLDGMIEQVDMFPTVLGLIEADQKGRRTGGRDFSAQIMDGTFQGRDYVFSENHDVPFLRYTAMARSEQYKLITCISGDKPDYEFYDIKNDPNELINMIDSADHSQIINHHKQALLDWFVKTKCTIPPASLP